MPFTLRVAVKDAVACRSAAGFPIYRRAAVSVFNLRHNRRRDKADGLALVEIACFPAAVRRDTSDGVAVANARLRVVVFKGSAGRLSDARPAVAVVLAVHSVALSTCALFPVDRHAVFRVLQRGNHGRRKIGVRPAFPVEVADKGAVAVKTAHRVGVGCVGFQPFYGVFGVCCGADAVPAVVIVIEYAVACRALAGVPINDRAVVDVINLRHNGSCDKGDGFSVVIEACFAAAVVRECADGVGVARA